MVDLGEVTRTNQYKGVVPLDYPDSKSHAGNTGNMANDSHSEASAPLLSEVTASQDEKETIKPTKSEKNEPPKTVLEFEDIGVWTIMREVKAVASWSLPTHAALEQGKELVAVFPIIFQFFQEIFSVSPMMMVIYLLSSFWSSTEVTHLIFYH